MKQKTIRKVIHKKFQDWKASLPEELHKLVQENTIITGGCFTSMLLGEAVNDFDFYFRTKETVLALCHHYKKQIPKESYVIDGAKDINEQIINQGGTPWKSIMLEGFDEYRVKIVVRESEVKSEKVEKYKLKFVTTNSISLSQKVQLVIRFWGEPDEIHHNFDFVHCKNYWTSWNNEFNFDKEALLATFGKELHYRGSQYPLCSIIRTRKFIKRGWSITAGEYLKMAFQLSKLDLTDILVLQDQLVGVDTAYFIRLIDQIDQPLTNDYLCNLIDRIFN